MFSRRLFLVLTGGALLVPRISWSTDEVPSLLDHILLGCNDLDRGIALVEQRTGIRAAFGGVHPGRGTRNALLTLGERRYLEIIAPDPKQNTVESYAAETLKLVQEATTPRLIGWAAHPGNIEAFAKKLGAAGITFNGPFPGSRSRPDGRRLTWKTLHLADDRNGLLPFFIEWGAESIHPSADAPAGCHLDRFSLADSNPAELSKVLRALGLDAPVEHGDKPQLHARISGPKSKFEITS
jgi:Glyoxalase-like domain